MAEQEVPRDVFEQFPAKIKSQLSGLRAILHSVAADLQLGDVEESLKWGQPSYAVAGGSPVRIFWSAQSPGICCLYFICSTKLVDTFRELHSDTLSFQGNRAIELRVDAPLPELALRQCLQLALTYHSIKHLPLLGA